MGDFVVETAVTGSGGRYTAHLSRDWEIWGPNGGYIAAIALRAAGAASSLPRPVSFSGHFLAVAEFAAVDLDVITLRATKRAASLRVSMTQNARAVFEAIVWVAEETSGLQHDATTMPAVPGPSQLAPIEELVAPQELRQRHRFWQNFEIRPIDFVPWHERKPAAPEWREWYRFRPNATYGDLFADAARALLLVDTMGWPAACQAHPRDHGYVAPSLDVNVHFHHFAPHGEWLLVDAVAPIADHGLIAGRARVWSADRRLLASGGGQMLCRPVPTATGR